MESFILIVALVASAAGTLVLLSCLAARRAELLKAFSLHRETRSRKDRVDDSEQPVQEDNADLPVVS